MPDKDRIFLSPEEAIGAIHTDFNLYSPQTRLFLELGPHILGGDISLIEDTRNDGVWIAGPGRRPKYRMQKISSQELGDMLYRNILTKRPTPSDLAEVCMRVFETPARAGQDAEGREGIWVDTCMEDFKCRQCGRCCRLLDYHDTLSEADYELWQSLGRRDILRWVGTSSKNGRVTSRTIWIVPGTRKYAETCPWLRENKEERLWQCLIHDVKPQICRQYPGTRKHARMTGCPGFNPT